MNPLNDFEAPALKHQEKSDNRNRIIASRKMYFSGIVFVLILLFLMIANSKKSYSQCSTPGTRTNPTVILGSYTSSQSGGLWYLGAGYSASFYMYSNSYFVIENYNSGRKVRISTCGASYDSQITLRDWSTDNYVAYVDDNGPLCSGTASSIEYTGTQSSQHMKVILNQYNCTTNSNYTYVTVSYVSEDLTPADPSSISATYSTVCPGSGTTLTANGAVGTVYWYSGGCGSTYLGTGSQITVYPNSSTNYYARNYNNGYYSNNCAGTTITVNSAPSVSSHPGNATVCSGSNSSFTVGASGTGLSYVWQRGISGSYTKYHGCYHSQ